MIRGCGTCRRSRLLRHSFARLWALAVFFLRFGITVQKADVISVWFRGQQRFAPCCSQLCWDRWTLRCLPWRKHVHPNASASRSECYSSRDHTRSPRLSFALAMVLTMNARRFGRSSGMGPPLNPSKEMGMVLQWLAQIALVSCLTQALIARTDLPMYASLSTHDSHSLKKKR